MQLDGCQSVSLAKEMRSGLNLLALGVRRRRSWTVVIDAAVILLAGTFVMVVQGDFFGFLVSFVQLLACGIATWAAVFIVDMAMCRGYGRACLESSGWSRLATPLTSRPTAEYGSQLSSHGWLAPSSACCSPRRRCSPGRWPSGSLPRAAWVTSSASQSAPACTQCSAGTCSANAWPRSLSLPLVKMKP